MKETEEQTLMNLIDPTFAGIELNEGEKQDLFKLCKAYHAERLKIETPTRPEIVEACSEYGDTNEQQDHFYDGAKWAIKQITGV